MLEHRIALPQPAIGAHRQPVPVLPQRVSPPRLLSDHQSRQRLAKQGFQPIALVDDPVIVETIQEVATVERCRQLQVSNTIVRGVGLEFISI